MQNLATRCAKRCAERISNQTWVDMDIFREKYKDAIDASLLIHDFNQCSWFSTSIKNFDDSNENLKMLETYLNAEGFKIEWCDNYYAVASGVVKQRQRQISIMATLPDFDF